MNVPSEKLKFVNGTIPVADAFAAGTAVHKTDIINMENYKKCTFIIATGATTTADGVVTVLAGADNTTCTTAIVFKYRTQIAAADCTTQGGDVPSTLTTVAVGGFAMTASKIGGLYIIEVDAAVVAAAGTNFDHIACHVAEDTDDPQTGCVIAILSEPRYPQDVLATAID